MDSVKCVGGLSLLPAGQKATSEMQPQMPDSSNYYGAFNRDAKDWDVHGELTIILSLDIVSDWGRWVGSHRDSCILFSGQNIFVSKAICLVNLISTHLKINVNDVCFFYRTVRVWLKRESGQYWPSIYHAMPCKYFGCSLFTVYLPTDFFGPWRAPLTLWPFGELTVVC